MFAHSRSLIAALSRKERRALVAAVLVASASAVALGLVVLNRTTQVVPAAGGSYTEAVVGQPVHVNPVTASSDADRLLSRLVFAPLGDLAEKIELQPDGRTWNVRLREGLTWQDGEKLTSDDVIFTVEKIQDPESQSPLLLAWQGVTARRLSELEIQFQLPAPYSFFGYNIAHLQPIPKHLFADAPVSNWGLSDYNLKPVGSGPYRFTSFRAQADGFVADYALQANPNYFKGRPFIDSVDFKFFKSSDDALKAFNAGQADGIAGIHPNDLGALERPYALYGYSLPSYYAIFLNQARNAALQDKNVRQALLEALDIPAITREALLGRGAPIADPLGGTPEPQNAADAASLLDRAGWVLPNPGAPVRVKTQGTSTIPLAVAITVPQIDFLVQTANLVAAAWQNLGVQATVNLIPPEQIVDDTIKNRDYEALIFGNVMSPPQDLYPFWDSAERFYPGLNLSLYDSKAADALLDAVRSDSDPAAQAAHLESLRTTISSDIPAVFLYSLDYLFVADKSIRGITGGNLDAPEDRMALLPSWYVRTARTLRK